MTFKLSIFIFNQYCCLPSWSLFFYFFFLSDNKFQHSILFCNSKHGEPYRRPVCDWGCEVYVHGIQNLPLRGYLPLSDENMVRRFGWYGSQKPNGNGPACLAQEYKRLCCRRRGRCSRIHSLFDWYDFVFLFYSQVLNLFDKLTIMTLSRI